MAKSQMFTASDLKAAADCIRAVLVADAHRATKFIAHNKVARATRVFNGGKPPRRSENIDIRVKIGRPNNPERKFIKLCKKAGEPFPVKKVRLSFSRKQLASKRKRK